MMLRRIIVACLVFFFIGRISNAQTLEELFKSNSRSSFETILKMAKKKNPEAMYYVGLSYEIGQGVKLNYKKAFVWYQRAANAGYQRAQYNLAFLYKYGYGTKKDMIQSYKWFYIAGYMYECDLDAQQMSPDEIKKAKELAMEWEKNHGY